MMNEIAENVGADFKEDKLLHGQKLAWDIIYAVSRKMEPGMTEGDARELLKQTAQNAGSLKYWHPPQIRFGENTTLSFGKPAAPDIRLQKNDIYFFDIGPLFDGYESDVGETFVLGDDADMKAIARDSKVLFNKVKAEWMSSGRTGQSLYDFAAAEAEKMGWSLSLGGASGHRISDFPHALHHRGHLKTFAKTPAANRWILEIHLLHKTRKIGAFFEDIL